MLIATKTAIFLLTCPQLCAVLVLARRQCQAAGLAVVFCCQREKSDYVSCFLCLVVSITTERLCVYLWTQFQQHLEVCVVTQPKTDTNTGVRPCNKYRTKDRCIRLHRNLVQLNDRLCCNNVS